MSSVDFSVACTIEMSFLFIVLIVYLGVCTGSNETKEVPSISVSS